MHLPFCVWANEILISLQKRVAELEAEARRKAKRIKTEHPVKMEGSSIDLT